ncbi:uncharacterized protein J5F26_016922 isoform 1-T1 [Ciconia maguari]
MDGAPRAAPAGILPAGPSPHGPAGQSPLGARTGQDVPAGGHPRPRPAHGSGMTPPHQAPAPSPTLPTSPFARPRRRQQLRLQSRPPGKTRGSRAEVTTADEPQQPLLIACGHGTKSIALLEHLVALIKRRRRNDVLALWLPFVGATSELTVAEE